MLLFRLLNCPFFIIFWGVGSPGGSCYRSEDDLTHKLAEIIKANNKLRRQDQNGAPQHIIREFSQLLQFHITTYFDNTKPGQPVAAQVSYDNDGLLMHLHIQLAKVTTLYVFTEDIVGQQQWQCATVTGVSWCLCK